MPLRSTGCFACRKRKIRCDEGRPGCQRCVTHRIDCPGYRGDENGGIEFKDQTDATVSRAKGEFKRGSRDGSALVMRRKRGRVGNDLGVFESEAETPLDCTTASSPVAIPNATATKTDAWSAAFSTARDLDPTVMPSFEEHFIPFPTSSTLAPAAPHPYTLSSPAVERASLYQSFIDAYLPRKTLRGVQEGHFTFFQTLALQRSTHPALQHGFDALSLVQIGSLYHDEGLLHQSTKQYALALRALGASIAKGDFLHDDEVLAAVAVLSSCELYEGIQIAGQGWSNHIAGANQLVAARGPGSLQSELALLLFANMRHGAMCHALIERKAPFMARKEWRDVAWRVPLRKDQSTLFYDVAIQVPALLERHDKLDPSSPTALEDIDALLRDSRHLERQLRDWFASWKAIGSNSFGGLCHLVPITDFPTFLGLCDDDAFALAFRFPDFLVGYLQTVYWLTMHALRTDIQSLHRERNRLQPDWYPDPGDEVQQEELLGYVLSLCQSIPYFCEPESSASGSIGIFLPMRTAVMYFAQHGHWRLLKWVGRVRNTVFVKGLRPPEVDKKFTAAQSPPKSVSTGSSPEG